MVTPWPETKVPGSRWAPSTSSNRDSAQNPISSLWYTGASSRSHWYTGYGLVWMSRANGLYSTVRSPWMCADRASSHRTPIAAPAQEVASQSSMARSTLALSASGAPDPVMDARATDASAASSSPISVRATSYSCKSTGPNSNGSSPFRLQPIPASSSWGSGCSANDGYTDRSRFDVGHTSSTTSESARRFTSSGSSIAR